MDAAQWSTCTSPDAMLDHLDAIKHPLLGDAWGVYLLATDAHVTAEFPADHAEACNAIRELVPSLEATDVSVSIGRHPDYQVLNIWGVYVLRTDGTTRLVRGEFSDTHDRDTAVRDARAYAARRGLRCSV